MPQPKQALISVQDNAHLQELCSRWLQAPLLALDTEFIRTNTFYPVPALLQVNDGEHNYLIDPLEVSDFTDFAQVLIKPEVRKVLHACSEDLEVFHRLFGVLPENLFDTQVAAAFAGWGFSLGYSALVEQLLGIVIPKDETRSDWLQRPLSEAQLSYAAMDVEFLYQLALKLLAKLRELERLDWAEAESTRLISGFLGSQQEDDAYLRFRGAWRLDGRQLALLKLLAAWRDGQAKRINKPRNHVIKDKALYQVAEQMPSHVAQLRKIAELSDKAIRRYGQTLVDWVEQAQQLNEATLPERLPRNPSSQQQAMIKTLRAQVTERAEQDHLAPELIARKKDYEYIVRAAAQGQRGKSLLPVAHDSWRCQYLLPVLEDVVWNI